MMFRTSAGVVGVPTSKLPGPVGRRASPARVGPGGIGSAIDVSIAGSWPALTNVTVYRGGRRPGPGRRRSGW